MRESYWGFWLILLGVFVIVIMMLISNVTTTNTQDYYLIKEVTEQSMVDAVDLGYYRTSGELRINADKFVESFIRRFAENVAFSTYDIDFYGIYEAPPKVSVKVTTTSDTYSIGASQDSFDIVNKIDAILELDGIDNGTNVSNVDNPPSTGNSATSDNNTNTGSINSNNTNNYVYVDIVSPGHPDTINSASKNAACYYYKNYYSVSKDKIFDYDGHTGCRIASASAKSYSNDPYHPGSAKVDLNDLKWKNGKWYVDAYGAGSIYNGGVSCSITIRCEK